VNVHAALCFIRQRPQSSDLLPVKVQLGRVIQAQHHLACPHPLGRALPVRLHDVGPFQLVLREEPISRRRLSPAAARQRNARRPIARQLGWDQLIRLVT